MRGTTEIKYYWGEKPTDEDWKAHYKVEAYSIAESVECWLEDNELEVSQEQFDDICRRIDWGDFGEEESMLIEYAYDDVVR